MIPDQSCRSQSCFRKEYVEEKSRDQRVQELLESKAWAFAADAKAIACHEPSRLRRSTRCSSAGGNKPCGKRK